MAEQWGVSFSLILF